MLNDDDVCLCWCASVSFLAVSHLHIKQFFVGGDIARVMYARKEDGEGALRRCSCCDGNAELFNKFLLQILIDWYLLIWNCDLQTCKFPWISFFVRMPYRQCRESFPIFASFVCLAFLFEFHSKHYVIICFQEIDFVTVVFAASSLFHRSNVCRWDLCDLFDTGLVPSALSPF